MPRPMTAKVLADRSIGRRVEAPARSEAEALEIVLRATQSELGEAVQDCADVEAFASELEAALETLCAAIGSPWDGEQPVEDNLARALSRLGTA